MSTAYPRWIQGPTTYMWQDGTEYASWPELRQRMVAEALHDEELEQEQILLTAQVGRTAAIFIATTPEEPE